MVLAEGQEKCPATDGGCPARYGCPCSYWGVKHSSEASCWLSTEQLSAIIYEHKPGAPKSNIEKFTQSPSALLSTMRVFLHSYRAQALEVSCSLPIPLATRFYFYLFLSIFLFIPRIEHSFLCSE